jgi:pimeloyl-ACP methyl ester carboxylesterase
MPPSLVALLAALLALAAPSGEERKIGQIFRAGEEAVWVFEANGARLGYHTSRYVGRDDLAGVQAHHFQGAYALKGAVDVRSTADLWTDDVGHPIRFVQQALVGDAYSRVDLAVAGDKSQARIAQGSSSREVTVQVDPAAYLLANNFVSHLEILLAELPRGENATVKLFSGNTLKGLDYTLTAKGTFEEDAGGKHVKGHVYEDSLGERLRFADDRLLDVEIQAAKLLIRRSSEHVDPITVSPPEVRKSSADFDSEEVKIRHDDAVIAGTLTKNKGAKGRLPAVFFVSGSGPQDRNGYSGGLDLGTHEILDRLTRLGFLVLRVDDRGTGGSSAMPPNASFLDLVADARACVEYLAKRDDVDPKRIVVIGHSEGAETAPILAAERPDIAAIVLMAPPGRSILEIIVDQNRTELEKRGLAKDELEKQMKEVREFLAKLASAEPIDPASMDENERAALANRAWIQSHAKQDPIATIRRVKCPVLILQGAKDFQVSPEKDAAALEAAMQDAHHPDHELHVLPGLDHLFKKTPGEKSELADYWKTRPVEAEFLDALAAWLKKRLKPQGS